MNNFQIKCGYKNHLIDEVSGNTLIELEDGCWYLTLDTAEVYVAITRNDSLYLCKINEAPDIDLGPLNDRFDLVENRLNNLETKITESDVLSYIDSKQFPTTGSINKIYIDISSNIAYRWDSESSRYISLSTTTEDLDIHIINGGNAFE